MASPELFSSAGSQWRRVQWSKGRMQVAKRFLDFIFAATSLILLSPVMACVALGVRLTSRGPVLYRGLRVGCNGRSFRMLKFRTMIVDSEALGGYCVGEDDPRITSFGRWLRKYKLDELPQLINVLRGQMSAVGPRPEVQKYVDLYTDEEKLILTVRPGITDWATLWDSDEGAILSGRPDPERTYLELIRPEKLRLQIKYVRHQCMLVDLKILITTIGLVLTRCFGDARSSDRKVQHFLGKQP
jgi:lipopolysaccharide/colanic/teichoic acid biosynthesis glycosyltransferase